jgi:predicted dehydrogenase
MDKSELISSTEKGTAALPTISSSARMLRGLAVIGLGYWGPNWVRNLSQSGCCRRIICCDLDSGRREHVQKLYPGVEATDRVDEVLEDSDIEGVIVATPVRTHYLLAHRALMAGKSVLVEKPLAMSCKEAAVLTRIARERERILMVGHTFEYSAPILRTHEIISSGELGDIFYISSVRANLGLFQRDINVVWDLATHDVSIILRLLGRVPETVSCQGQSHYRADIEDVAMVTLCFSANVIAFIHVSWLDPNKIRRTTIAGSKKMLVYDDTALQEKIRIYDKGVKVMPYYDTFGEFQLAYQYGDILIPRIEEVEPLKVECEHFVDCIRTGQLPSTDGVNGTRVVSVLEAAERSLRNSGTPVSVEREAWANGQSELSYDYGRERASH